MKIKFKELKSKYQLALNNGDKTFFVEDTELLVGFAKYLIEYLENQCVQEGQLIDLVKK